MVLHRTDPPYFWTSHPLVRKTVHLGPGLRRRSGLACVESLRLLGLWPLVLDLRFVLLLGCILEVLGEGQREPEANRLLHVMGNTVTRGCRLDPRADSHKAPDMEKTAPGMGV